MGIAGVSGSYQLRGLKLERSRQFNIKLTSAPSEVMDTICCPKWFEEPVEYSSLWRQYPPFIFWFFDPSQVYILFPVWRATEMAIRRRIHRGKECSSLTKNSPNPSITNVYHPGISTATTVAVASVPKFQQKEFAFFCISSLLPCATSRATNGIITGALWSTRAINAVLPMLNAFC